MGLFDRLTFEEGLEIGFPDIGVDPFEITWQTKSIQPPPSMENFKVTPDGRLFREDAEWEVVPEEERPGYDKAIGGFESEIDETWGMFRTVHHGWTDTAFHGTFEFHTSVDDDYISLEAKFTDGTLVSVTRTER